MFPFFCRHKISSRTFLEVHVCALKVCWKINCYSKWTVSNKQVRKRKTKLIITTQPVFLQTSLCVCRKLTKLLSLDIFTAIFTCQKLHRLSRLQRTFKGKKCDPSNVLKPSCNTRILQRLQVSLVTNNVLFFFFTIKRNIIKIPKGTTQIHREYTRETSGQKERTSLKFMKN